MQTDLSGRAILIPGSGQRYAGSSRTAQYALTIFGRSMRETNCDCDRTQDVSLLQTVYLQNDDQLLNQLTDSKNSWLAQIQREFSIGRATTGSPAKKRRRPANYKKVIELRKEEIKQLRTAGKDEAGDNLERQVRAYRKRFDTEQEEPSEKTSQDQPLPASEVTRKIVQSAYLRTLSRYPTDQELQRSVKYLVEARDVASGARDLLWALLNTKEFILNH